MLFNVASPMLCRMQKIACLIFDFLYFDFKAIKSPVAIILKPGRNTITLSLPPQKPGSYVLGVLTGQIGHLRFRSHSFSKGGPADTDDFMSYEKPTKPILKVLFFLFNRKF